MDQETMTALRSFVGEGLVSLNTEDIEEPKDNILWTAAAQRDWQSIKGKITVGEIQETEKAVKSLGILPKQRANLPDTMLDLEGVRCLAWAEILIFYKYNSSYNLVDILRLSHGNRAWLEYIEQVYKPV